MLVSAGEAEALDEATAARSAVDARKLNLEFAEDESFLGLQWDWSTSTMRAHFTSSTDELPAATRSRIDRAAESTPTLRPETVRSRLTATGLAELQAEIMGQVEQLDRHGNVTADIDITCGRLMVVVGDQRDRGPLQKIVEGNSDIVSIVVSPELAGQPASRYDHHSFGQIGGLNASIWDENLNRYVLGTPCTSAIPMQFAGHLAVVTAAHCGTSTDLVGDGQLHLACNTLWVQGNQVIADHQSCARYQLGGRVDVLVMRIFNSEPGDSRTMYNGGAHGIVAMGWWEWDRNLATIGDIYCHSGRNWADVVCGTLSSKTASGCVNGFPGIVDYPNHCLNTMFNTTFTSLGGDSGATVYRLDTSRHYAGVLTNNLGWFTHIQDFKSALGLGPPVNMF